MSKRLWLQVILGISPFIELPASSSDLDIDVATAQAAYNQQKKISDNAKVNYDFELSVLRPLEADLANAQSRFNQANNQVINAQNTLTNLRNTLNQQTSDLSSERSALERLEQTATTIRRDLNSEKDRASDLERTRTTQAREVDRIKGDIRNEELNGNTWTCVYQDTDTEEHSGGHSGIGSNRNTAESAARGVCENYHPNSCSLVSCNQYSARLDMLRRDLSRAENELSNTESRLSQSRTRVRDFEYQLDANATEQRQKQQRISSIQNNIDNTRLEISGAQQNLTVAQNDRSNAQSDVNRAQASVNQQKPRVDHTRSIYDKELASTQNLYAYLQQVIANYETEKRNSVLLGQENGTKHGSQEGKDRSAAVGSEQGLSDGESQARSIGLVHAAEKSFASGYATGRANGASIPNLEASYQFGLSKGTDLANRKAVSEKLPEGYNSEFSRVITSTPTQSQSLDITSSIPTDPGSNGEDLRNRRMNVVNVDGPVFTAPASPQAKVPQPGVITPVLPQADGRYQNQPCDGLRTQEFIELCKKSYSSSYQTGYKDGYSKGFNSAYAGSFNQVAATTYDQVFSTEQPQEVLRGQKNGAEHLGILTGFASHLPSANGEQLALGLAKLQSELNDGYLIIGRNVALNETSGDGVLSPGEKAKLTIVIDNLGKLASPMDKLRVKITNVVNAKSLSVALRGLPALTPDTRTTLEGTVSAESAAAFAGDAVSLEGLLELETQANTFDPVMAFVANKTSHFPIELTAIQASTPLPLGKASEVIFQFKNQSNLDLPATKLVLAKVRRNLEVTNPNGVDIPELKSGETTTLKISVKPDYTVDLNSPAVLTVDTLDSGGVTKLTQTYKQGLPVNRPAKIEVINKQGTVITTPIAVKAGSAHRFLVKFSCTTSVPRSPFKFGFFGANEPGVRITDNTTLFGTNRACNASTPPENLEFSVNIPLTAKGKSVTITMGVDENVSPIHRISYVMSVQ